MLNYLWKRLLGPKASSEGNPGAVRVSHGENVLAASSGFNHCVLGREGYAVFNVNDVYIGRAIKHYGEYSGIEAAFLRQLLHPGAVVIEAGANIGTHTQVIAHAVHPGGFVFAYEPQRIVFQTLCANLALNSITNVDARCAAVGAEAGHILLPDFNYDREGNFGGIEINRYLEGQRIPRVTLDNDFHLPRLDLIKIDVEGMELEVLQGAQRLLDEFRPTIYVENDRPDKSAALIRHLLERNYRLYWHLPPLFNPDNHYQNPENLFPRVVSINMLCIPPGATHDFHELEEITDPSALSPVHRYG